MKRTSKSLLALLIAAMLCMVCFVGCTDKGTAESGDVQNATVEPETDKTGETVTITFWIDNTTDAREATYQKLIDQFEDENPNIKVELLGVAGDMTQKLDTALAAGSPPDCSTLIQGSVSSLILNNKLVPLDSYLADWDCYDQVLPSAWETVLSFNPIMSRSIHCRLPAMSGACGSTTRCMRQRILICRQAGRNSSRAWRKSTIPTPRHMAWQSVAVPAAARASSI